MTGERRVPFCAWPGWAHLRLAGRQTLLVSAWFVFVYVGADWVTAQRATRVRIYFSDELKLPLVPAFLVGYMSIYVLFLAAPFVLRTRREFISLARAQALAILVAGICFMMIPAHLGFPPATDLELGKWRALFRFADQLNLDYNLVPSLHVALSVICLELFVPHAGAAGKLVLRLWAGLIAAATVLTHQHQLVDAVTGYLLAGAVLLWVRRARH